MCTGKVTAVIALGLLILTGGGRGWAQTHVQSGAAQLQPFAETDALARYLKEGLLAEAQLSSVLRADEAGSLMAIAAPHYDPSLAWSLTKIMPPELPQADTIASDGRYLYVLPEAPIELALDTASANEDNDTVTAAVRILELVEDPPDALPVAQIEFEGHTVAPSGLYLFAGAGKRGEDLLVTVGNQVREAAYFWSTPLDLRRALTEVVFYDVSLPESPRATSRLVIQGQLIASRRTGNSLHLITRYLPSPPGYRPHVPGSEAAETNRDAIENTGIEDLLPAYRIDQGRQISLTKAESCFKAPTHAGLGATASLLTITTVDVSAPEVLAAQTIAGLIEALHVSEDTVYAASVRSVTRPRDDSLNLGIQDLPIDTAGPQVTDIHKFDLAEEGAVYRGSGSVVGRIGRTAEERPLWIDDFQANLRVATWLPAENEKPGSLRLTILRETPSWDGLSSLEEIARLDNLDMLTNGRIGLRFCGPFALVSSHRPDTTLHLIDLSDPLQPAVWKELSAVGNVDRLIELGNGFLLGLGRQHASNGDVLPRQSPDTQPRGITLLLVDARDPMNLKIVDLIDIGKQGTQSDAISQRQALDAQLSADGSMLRLVLPIQLHDVDAQRPERGIDWIHTGLYLFDVYLEASADNGEKTGFDGPQVIIADKAADPRKVYWAFNRGTDRVLVLGTAVHYVHQGRIWSAPLEKPDEAIGPR
jgi:hypothetical protein